MVERKSMSVNFSKTRALREYRENRRKWSGGAVIVRVPGGYQAIPGAYLSDVSYTGSRVTLTPSEVRATSEWRAIGQQPTHRI